MRNLAINAATLGFATFAVLTAAELALRLGGPASERHYVLQPKQSVTLTPLPEYVHGVTGTSVYRVSSEGIRGDEFSPDDEYRILAIGASTTQNAYLDQTETWTLVLSDLLEEAGGPRTWTGDVGRSGHTARTHVLQFEHLLPELPRIDAVVMLVGVNDLTVALRKGYAYTPDPPLSDSSARREQLRQAFLEVPGRLHERATNYQADGVPAFKRLALYQLGRAAAMALRQARGATSQDEFGRMYSTWRQHRAQAERMLDTLPDLTEALGEYRAYLTEIAGEAVRREVRLVLLTQPTLWREDLSERELGLLWLGGTGDFQAEAGQSYFSVSALRTAMDAYNATLMSVCEDFAVECFDLAAHVPRDTAYFYDDVHFTERGSRLVAELLGGYFKARPPYSDLAVGSKR